MKTRLIKMLVQYVWWILRAPNTEMAMRGLTMDLAGDLYSYKRRLV